MGKISTAGVLRLRATSAVSRNNSVRRSAQDDDFVGVSMKNILNKLALMGLRSWATKPTAVRIQHGCTPEERVIQRPLRDASERPPISLREGVRQEPATAILSPTAVALD
jgi:hypothetical protein